MYVPRHGGRAVAIIAIAGLPCLGLVSGPVAASAAHVTSSSVAATHHGVPELLAPKVLHVPDAYEMQGVSCVSATHCVAVGYGDYTSKVVAKGVLVPITDGKTGKPLVSTAIQSLYYGVSCITATKCVVAGQVQPTSSSGLVAELWLWNGHKLAPIRQTTATNVESSGFRGVACMTAITCVADGNAEHDTSLGGKNQPIAVLGVASLKGSPTDDVVLNDAAGYAAGATCPTTSICYIGASTLAGTGDEVRVFHGPKGYDLHGTAQPDLAGLEGIACVSVHSCEASGDSSTETFGIYHGWLDHIDGFAPGSPHELLGTQQMFATATVNHSYYLSVGYASGVDWVTDLVSAAGKPGAIGGLDDGGYLQGVTCPVQTQCVAVGFTNDSNPKQPGGQHMVDGAIAIFHLKTAPSAPRVTVKAATHTSETVRITPPSSDGDVAISSYRLAVTRCKPHHAACTLEPVRSVHVNPGKLTLTVRGLSANTTYYFAATATNAIGTSPSSTRVHRKTG
jgi:hypothetical protein